MYTSTIIDAYLYKEQKLAKVSQKPQGSKQVHLCIFYTTMELSPSFNSRLRIFSQRIAYYVS